MSSKVSAREAKAGPSGWRSSNGDPTGLANCMRLMAVKRKACKCSDIMVGPHRIMVLKRGCELGQELTVQLEAAVFS